MAATCWLNDALDGAPQTATARAEGADVDALRAAHEAGSALGLEGLEGKWRVIGFAHVGGAGFFTLEAAGTDEVTSPKRKRKPAGET